MTVDVTVTDWMTSQPLIWPVCFHWLWMFVLWLFRDIVSPHHPTSSARCLQDQPPHSPLSLPRLDMLASMLWKMHAPEIQHSLMLNKNELQDAELPQGSGPNKSCGGGGTLMKLEDCFCLLLIITYHVVDAVQLSETDADCSLLPPVHTLPTHGSTPSRILAPNVWLQAPLTLIGHKQYCIRKCAFFAVSL